MCSREATKAISMSFPDINAAIAARGPDFHLGLDTDRIWSTGAQAFVNPDVTMLIFREQNLFPMADGTTGIGLKNVASIVIPTQILREFHANLGQTLAALETANQPSTDA